MSITTQRPIRDHPHTREDVPDGALIVDRGMLEQIGQHIDRAQARLRHTDRHLRSAQRIVQQLLRMG